MPGPVDTVVEAACRLPHDYESFGNRSAVELIRRSGYVAHRSEVTVDRVEAFLSEESDLVDAWIRWSEDNRGSPAWYILKRGETEFEVGWFDGTLHPLDPIVDRVRACAEYVHRELGHLADLA